MRTRLIKFNRWWYALGMLATAVALYFFVGVLLKNISELPEIAVSGRVICGFSISLVIYVTVLALGALVWYLLIKGLGVDAHPVDTFRIFFVSQFAKYIPGNIGHHIGRVVLARDRGMDTARVLMSMVIETSWAISAAAVLAIIAMMRAYPLIHERVPNLPTAAQLSLVAVASLLIPVLGAYFLSSRKTSIVDRILGDIPITSPGGKILFSTFLLYLVNFILTGGIIGLLASEVFQLRPLPVFSTAGIFALAWVVGFLTPGAPAGLGVREVILVSLLSPAAGAGAAIGITLTLRLVTTLGEAVVFIMGLGLGRIPREDPHKDEIANVEYRGRGF